MMKLGELIIKLQEIQFSIKGDIKVEIDGKSKKNSFFNLTVKDFQCRSIVTNTLTIIVGEKK